MKRTMFALLLVLALIGCKGRRSGGGGGSFGGGSTPRTTVDAGVADAGAKK